MEKTKGSNCLSVVRERNEDKNNYERENVKEKERNGAWEEKKRDR